MSLAPVREVAAATVTGGACPVFTAVSAGADHSVALATDGTVWTWGRNDSGQLGDGTTTGRQYAAPVPGLVGVTAVTAGARFSLALGTGGVVWAWGANSFGQLGDGTTIDRHRPVTGPVGIAQLDAGAGHVVAAGVDDTLQAWGHNNRGQLGDGTTTDRHTPVTIGTFMPGSSIVDVDAGGDHSMAVLDSSWRYLFAWGANSFGQVGDGSMTDRTWPVPVLDQVGFAAAGKEHSLVTRLFGPGIPWGYALAWGSNASGQVGQSFYGWWLSPAYVPGGYPVDLLAAGDAHSLARRDDGTLLAWGANASGQLGDGTTTQRDTPVAVPGLTSVAGLAAGAAHSLAVGTDGVVRAWGANGHGQLGDGTTTGRTTAVEVTCEPPPVAPVIGSVADGPDPVPAGGRVTFAVDWTDTDTGDEVRAMVCRTGAVSEGRCSGGAWAAGSWSATSPASAAYPTREADVGTHAYYAFACDTHGLCSASVSGTFTVTATPACTTLGNACPYQGRESYLVVLADTAAVPPDVFAAQAAGRGARIRYVYRDAPRGFSAFLPPDLVLSLSNDPAVAHLHRSVRTTRAATQADPPWGLDRIGQRPRELDGKYDYTVDGGGVTAYVVDSGIRYDHVDFGGRAVPGFDAFGGNGGDVSGHGTGVAGVLGGSTYGVAKGVRLVSVKVLTDHPELCDEGDQDPRYCDDNDRVIAGLQWIRENHAAGAPAVANLSLGSGADPDLDAAIRATVADGVSITVAAGNADADACDVSPARVAEAMTVGATGRDDHRAVYATGASNFGDCVDWYAPGAGIRTASRTGGATLLSGTSMAASHSAGAAALFLQQNPAATPARVARAISDVLTRDVVFGAGSVAHNDLLYVPSGVPSVAYCDYGHVSGRITYSPPVAVPGIDTTWQLDLTLSDCTGAAPAAGSYTLRMTGTSNDSCAAGIGSGTVFGTGKTAGTGTGEVVDGFWEYSRAAVHYYGYPPNGDGAFVVREASGDTRRYKMYLWLDLTTITPCPGFGGPIVGHAAIVTDA